MNTVVILASFVVPFLAAVLGLLGLVLLTLVVLVVTDRPGSEPGTRLSSELHRIRRRFDVAAHRFETQLDRSALKRELEEDIRRLRGGS